MALKLEDILASARVHLADSRGATPGWGDSELTPVVNLAINELIPVMPKHLIPYYAGEGAINIASGTSKYVLGSFTPAISALHTVDAVYYDGFFCRQTTRDQVRMLEKNVYLAPARHAPVYWLHEDDIYIRPVPDEEITSGLVMNYRIQPTVLVYTQLSGTVEFPDSFLQPLGLLAAGRAKVGGDSAQEGMDLVKGAYGIFSSLAGYEIKLREAEEK